MPGLSQLKQFNQDLLAIGDETRRRAFLGERPVLVPIPKSVVDKDDSDDFVLGMPEFDEDGNIKVETPPEDDDFSDITGIVSDAPASVAESSNNVSNSLDAPDLTSLLNPVIDTSGGNNDIPDLSQFAEPELEEEIEDEPEEEASIADLSLDDLLKSTGFEMDNPAEEDFDFMTQEPEPEPEPVLVKEPEPEREIVGAPNLDFLMDNDVADDKTQNVEDESPVANDTDFEFLNDLETPAEPPKKEEPKEQETPQESEPPIQPIENFSLDDDLKVEPVKTVNLSTEPAGENFTFDDSDFEYDGDAIDLTASLPDDVAERDVDENVEQPQAAAEETGDFGLPGLDELDDIGDAGDFELDSGDEIPAEEDEGTAEEFSDAINNSSTSLLDSDDLDSSLDNLNFDIGDAAANTSDEFGLGEMPAETPSADDFSLDDISFDEPSADASPSAGEETADGGFDVDSLGDFGAEAEIPVSEQEMSSLAYEMEAPETTPASDSGLDFGMDSLSSDAPAETANFDVDSLLGDLGIDGDVSSNAGFADGVNSDAPLETFDTSEMEGMDFSIPATDAQLSGDTAGDANGEFEIAGYTDTDIAEDVRAKAPTVAAPQPTTKNKKSKKEEELPPDNTLTDEQYKKFLKNLSGYPLNVRIAIEDLLVKNEFTDDAEFEVVKKVLNKVPARQLAGHLEKMLDISISVPRDFERRSASEYEALKSSFQYQLKNRIIPIALVTILAGAVLFGLFQVGYRFVYKPLKANSLYKQGYTLIESNDYPQSEILFEEAVKYNLQKNWFYKYAQGYREHKQYDRAEKMYRNILYTFKHDKQAGLEYADMEVKDLANYEKAENILRREVLDYHVNDADALLALGDVFLEWATERDASKFEDAREQYASLIELYGQTNLYLSRMMRYFVRTDNLREVLQLKEHFIAQKKNPLSGPDWTEMSGYLLDKLFGPLSPSDEYLRRQIEDVREMLVRAVENDPDNPVAMYNMARYYIQLNNHTYAKAALQQALTAFKNATSLKQRDVYKHIDSFRLLGEQFVDEGEYLSAREIFTDGIALYQTAHDDSGLEGTSQIGELFADMGDIDYFVEGNNNNAYRNYVESVNLGNDTSAIRYKIGYIDYYRQDYDKALDSFLRSADGTAAGDDNLLLALGNTLSLRGNNYAAEGYYSRLMDQLEVERAQRDVLLPQIRSGDADFVELMMHAANNYGVSLYKLASQTGSSAQNAQAMVYLSLSMRAWDAMTRNQETLVRIGGSNLAEQNMSYMSRPISQFEPTIFTDLPRTLAGDEGLGR